MPDGYGRGPDCDDWTTSNGHGRGIGQSRLSLLLLRKAHNGEVPAGIWPEKMAQQCRENNMHLF